MLDKRISLQEVIDQIKANQSSEKSLWPYRNEITIRVESAKVDFYDKQLFEVPIEATIAA